MPEEPTAGQTSTLDVLVCANCQTEALPGEVFCENCGQLLPGQEQAALETQASVAAALPGGPAPAAPPILSPAAAAATQPIDEETPAAVCANCGRTEFEDGYCTNCGTPVVKARDHWLERPADWVAAVSDRGIRHHRNEDGMALSAGTEPGSRAVLVVCDGVSSSIDSDIASLAAARAARDLLTSADASTVDGDRTQFWTERLTQAATAANSEVVEVSRNPTGRPGERQHSPASCTFVVGIVDGPLVVTGWVGDSRAYWVPDTGTARQLSVDDSWASEAMMAGMTREQAESAPQAHAITRWLGVDSPAIQPRCAGFEPESAGWLLVCSDGLWNYCSPATAMGELVSRTAAALDGDPARTAAGLVDWANAQGGMDNITVALARLDGDEKSRIRTHRRPEDANLQR